MSPSEPVPRLDRALRDLKSALEATTPPALETDVQRLVRDYRDLAEPEWLTDDTIVAFFDTMLEGTSTRAEDTRLAFETVDLSDLPPNFDPQINLTYRDEVLEIEIDVDPATPAVWAILQLSGCRIAAPFVVVDADDPRLRAATLPLLNRRPLHIAIATQLA